MTREVNLVNFGKIEKDSKLIEIEKTSDGMFHSGKDGVNAVLSTADKKVELIGFNDKTMAYVPSILGYDAYYPIYPVSFEKPVKAVLMDLDGTSVKSETFWMFIIGRCVAHFTKNDKFEFEECDKPHIAGHSVSEHLTYCINKYCPGVDLFDMRKCYNDLVSFEMSEIMQGRGNTWAFTPADGLKDFLLELKANKVKIGLVTSGLYEKAMPEIISAFKTLNMGDPVEFYDAIITAGTAFKKGQTGTMSELPIKPHPWVYSETGRFGLNVPFEERNSVIAIEDSGAGVCSSRLAGYTTVGIGGGNIIASGTKDFCSAYKETLCDIKDIILG